MQLKVTFLNKLALWSGAPFLTIIVDIFGSTRKQRTNLSAVAKISSFPNLDSLAARIIKSHLFAGNCRQTIGLKIWDNFHTMATTATVGLSTSSCPMMTKCRDHRTKQLLPLAHQGMTESWLTLNVAAMGLIWVDLIRTHRMDALSAWLSGLRQLFEWNWHCWIPWIHSYDMRLPQAIEEFNKSLIWAACLGVFYAVTPGIYLWLYSRSRDLYSEWPCSFIADETEA